MRDLRPAQRERLGDPHPGGIERLNQGVVTQSDQVALTEKGSGLGALTTMRDSCLGGAFDGACDDRRNGRRGVHFVDAHADIAEASS